MKNSVYKLSMLLLLYSLSFNGLLMGQTEWGYISPIPGSKNINPGNNIAFRNDVKIDNELLRNISIVVVGSKSGVVDGEVILANDEKTVIFNPERLFEYGEKIEVEISINSNYEEAGFPSLSGTWFYIKDNVLVRDDNVADDISFVSSNDVPPGSYTSNRSNDLITYGEASLPENFIVPEILVSNNPSPGLTFYAPEPISDRYGYYMSAVDKYGVPVFYREWPDKAANFHVVANDLIVHKNIEPDVYDRSSFLVLNTDYEIIDTLRVGNGYKTNTHDMLMKSNGNHYLIIYDPQPVGMDTVVPGGNPNATVKGFVLQELDSDHNVIFQWRSWDHVNITDANHVDLTAQVIDYIHVNAIDTTADGNVLICCRHFDEVIKINRNTGDIMWRFGPKSKNNMFTFDNDTVGFTYQHDIQQLENGNLTLYDNGNYHVPNYSRALEYEIDEQNLTASLVWEYRNDPDYYASAKGGARRLENGNTMIGWGKYFPVVSTEVDPNGEKKWEMALDSAISYRTMKFNWKTTLFETSYDTVDYGYYNGYEPWPVVVSVQNNAEYPVTITSASHHLPEFSLETVLPVVINPAESEQIIVSFFPDETSHTDYEDVLTLNYDSYFSDTLHQRISRQLVLKGTTIDPMSIAETGSVQVSINPNPVHDIITIRSNSDIDKIVVVNSLGQKIRHLSHVDSGSCSINLGDNDPGVYIVFVYTEGASSPQVKKLLKR